MLESCKNKYTANWFLNPKQVLKDLGIRVRLQMEDWQVLKQYPFGEFAYDYEEGLKFRGDFNQIAELLLFIKTFHADNTIPFSLPTGKGKNKRMMDVFQISCCDSSQSKAFAKVVEPLGLTLDKQYGYSHVLTDTATPIKKEEVKTMKKKIESKSATPIVNPVRAKLVMTFYEKTEKVIGPLSGRWADEHEYEDINDYATPIKKHLKKNLDGAEFIKMTKRPFGFHFKFMGATYHLFCSSNKYGYKQIAEDAKPVSFSKPEKSATTPKTEAVVPSEIKIGDFIKGFTITEVDGKKVYGVEGKLPKKQIKELIAHFSKPKKERAGTFCFRPGKRIDPIFPEPKKSCKHGRADSKSCWECKAEKDAKKIKKLGSPKPTKKATYSQQELSDAFDLVKNKENWKKPVRASLKADANIDLIECAIMHFTGSAPFTTKTARGYKIKAAGYYAAVGC